jgi:hypothetical protein
MTRVRGIAGLAVGLALSSLLALSASAQQTGQSPGQPMGQTPQGRDCQTVRTCNFTRTGDVRGCLSSYSCRACRMVAVKCTLPNTAACREMRCDWGG